MKKRRFIALAMILGLGALLFYLSTPPTPTYNGQSLEVWFRRLPLAQNNPAGANFIAVLQMEWNGNIYGTTNAADQGLSVKAIQALGTNALPYVMAKLSRPQPAFMHLLERWANKIGFHPAFLRDPRCERYQAVTALVMLSPLPPDAIEEVKKLSTDKDRDLSAQATFILSLSTNSPAELKNRQDMIASLYGAR